MGSAVGTVLGRGVRGPGGFGGGEGHGEAEDVVGHAGFFGGFSNCGFGATVDKAAEEDFVFCADVWHGERITGKAENPKSEHIQPRMDTNGHGLGRSGGTTK